MILGIFSQLNGSGGIQRIGRHTASSIAYHAKKQKKEFLIFGLNDAEGKNEIQVEDISFEFIGFGKKKISLISSAIKISKKVTGVYINHVNLCPVGFLMQKINPSLDYWVEIYGIDAWKKFSFFKKHSFKKAKNIVSVCQFTADKAEKINKINKKRFVVIPPAIDPIFWKSREKLKTQENTKKEKILLTVCRLDASEKYKGLDHVICALPKIQKQFKNCQYFIVGDGNDRERLEKLSKEVGVEDSVIFEGNKSTQELHEYYHNCDVFLQPSNAEGWSSVYMEAMFFSKPAIGCNDGGTPEIVLDGKTGFLVKYADIEKIARTVIDIFQNPEEAKKIAEAGRVRVEKEFTFKNRIQRIEKLLEGNPETFI